MTWLQKLLRAIESWHHRQAVQADVARFEECRAPRCTTLVDRHSRGFAMYRGCCSPRCHEYYRSFLPFTWPPGAS